jgi:5-methyltetrahydrofolate--homocysteine methyltransferase
MDLLEAIRDNVIAGKVDAASKYPPAKRGEPGVAEQVEEALKNGMNADDILRKALMPGMAVVGQRFKANEIFVPEVLMSAKAMKAGMEKLRPHFSQESQASRGLFIIGTVQGDIHDIGKNLVSMMFEGAGFQVIDLGVDVKPEKFIEAASQNPKAVVGLSALLTTTMLNMKSTVQALRDAGLKNTIIIGGAPVTEKFAQEISADAYAPDPQTAVEKVQSLQS